MSARRVAPMLALVLGACSPAPDKFRLVRNHCERDDDCRVQSGDAGDLPACNLERKRCERTATIIPYRLVLQISLSGDRGMLVPRSTRPAVTLVESVRGVELTVPEAVTVTGAIRDPDGDLIAAAVTLSPIPAENVDYPVSSETLYTGAVPGDPDKNFQAVLDPNTRYDVRIEPLRADSKELPPRIEYNQMFASDAPFEFTYPALAKVQLALRDPQGTPLTNAYVRLVDRVTGSVISSTNQSDEAGVVNLSAPPERITAGFEIMLGVARTAGSPWLVQLRADPARRVLDPDGGPPSLTIPTLPAEVQYEGRLEMPATVDATLVDPSELVFVSTFPAATTGVIDDRYWCRARGDDPLPPFVCRAQIGVTTDAEGRFNLPLLPGEYRAYARPSGASEPGQEVRTVREVVTVQRPDTDGGTQGGQLIQLLPSINYTGRVVTPDRRESPNVTVRAEALDVTSDTANLMDLAEYARSIEVISDDSGAFRVGVDVGYYDLSLRPPADTGFAWSYITNRYVTGEDPGGSLGELVLQSPVVYAGRVVDPDGRPIPSATVDAYAIIRALDGNPRAVRVASSPTTLTGAFELLLPPQMEQADEPATMSAP